MTPLDDELRRTLSARAATVAPSPDPLAGIESRARSIRRRRTAAAVAGAVAAVAAVAVAVPALVPSRTATVTPGATPSVTASAEPSAQAPQRPANVLTWPLRGKDGYSPDTLDLRRRFAQAFDRTDVEHVEYVPLFVDGVDGTSFTTGQAWFTDGSSAYTVSYSVGPDNVPQFFLGRVTPSDPWGLVFHITGMGQPHDLLVVVPRPGVGQISYAPHATGAFVPVADGRSDLEGVAEIPRDLNATDDRLQVLDGDGNLDNPLYRGPVQPLLCGLKDCG
jgi:hypothetical protein